MSSRLKPKSVEQKFKPVPKKILPVPEIVHSGNKQTGPFCGVKGITQDETYVVSQVGGEVAFVIQNVTCPQCLELYERAFSDKLYGTSPEEDETLP
jgi:hypothetical protein